MSYDNVKEMREFLYEASNSCNCDECPMNEEIKGNNVLPCGQYHCWVDIHCKRIDESE